MPPDPTDKADEQPQQLPEDLDGEDLFKLISKPMDEVLNRYVDQEVNYEKQWQLLRLQKCDLYNRGLQFPILDDTAGYIGWSQNGIQSTATGDGQDDGYGTYDYNIDIVDSYGKKYTATLGLRPFYNAVAVPDDPQSEIDRKSARQANLCAVWMRNKWQVRIKNIMLANKQYTSGTVYVHNPFIADKQIFGEIEEQQFRKKTVMQPGSPDPFTGAPSAPQPMEVVEEAEPKKYPATGPAFFIYDGMTVTVPFTCSQFSNVPWLLLEKEENRGILLQLYGRILRSKMNESGELNSSGPATTAEEQGRRTRATAASLTGTYRPGSESLWTHSRYWVQPPMYEFIQEESIRAILYQKFPLGLNICKVEGTTVKLENADLNAEWGCIMPYPGNTIYQDPVCWGILGNQDIINFLANIGVAREERGLPTAVVDAELIDTTALAQRRYLPNELIEAKASFGGSLREAMVSLPTPNKDDGAGAALHNLVETNTQNRLGLQPSVWGGVSQQETAAGQRMEISQGLMQLAVPGEMISQGYAEAYMRGCKQIEKHAPKGFVIADEGKGSTSEMLDIEALKAGKYHFESDPGMPMTRAEMVETINGVIKENPDLAMAMGFMAPLAATALRELLVPGMPEIPSPLGDVRDKVIERIQLLLQQQPTPGPPDPMTGQPGPMMPSILPEEYVDDPGQHAEMTREWLNSAPGRKINPYLGGDPKNMPGYQNVVAYGLYCTQKAMPPPAPPPAPKPPTLSIAAKAVDLVDPAVQQVLAQDFGLGVPQPGGAPPQGPPPPQPGPQGPPQNQGGPQHPMAHPAPGSHQMAPPTSPLVQ